MSAVIAGYKKGGGSQHIPTEASDSLRSKASVHILDLISEGEIEGLVAGAQSIYLDDTPLQNPDGSFNFNGVTIATRNGTQGQSYIPGFSAVESETAVNVKATTAAPVVRSISSSNLNALRVRVLVPALTYQDLSNADTSGYVVRYGIDIQDNGGGYVPQPIGTGWVTGATTVTNAREQRATMVCTRIKGVLTATPNASATVVILEWKKTTDSVWSSGAVINLQELILGIALKNSQATGSTSFSTLGTKPISFVTPSLPSALYDVRIRIISGPGNITLSAVSVYGATAVLTISGKSSGPYQRSHRVSLSGNGPWDVRLRRITADNALGNIQNDIYFDAYTEIIDAKLRYPNSALVGIQCDASQFSSVPTRGYRAKLLRVKIPSNYNPTTRVYTGVWDGTFVVAWTDNPAWCYYDLLTNPRYALGNYIAAANVDKWALYTIGQYCDVLVPDGFGGTEPRFRLNIYLQTRAEAYKVLNDLASCFRGMLYYGNAGVTAVQDSPADPVYLYTPANVIDGMFNYAGSSLSTRHTVALVAWNDPSDFYRRKVEYVEDAAGIALYGVVESEVTAIGCTSRGQAHRAGRWLLYSERLLTDTVSFKVGLDGAVARPGQIIKIADPAKATIRLGGRLLTATTTVLGLDAPVTLGAFTYTLSVMLPNGTLEARTVTTGAGTVSTLTVGSAFSATPSPGAVWVIESSQVTALTYRVLIATEDSKNKFTLVGLLHNEGLYAAVETGVQLEAVTGTLQLPLPVAPTTILVDSSYYTQAGTSKIRMSVSWDRSSTVAVYRVSYRRVGNNWTTLPDTGQSYIEVEDVLPGDYEVEVVAFDSAARRAQSTFGGGTVDGKTVPPSDVTGFVAQQNGAVVLFKWDQVSDIDLSGYEIRYVTQGSGLLWDDATPISKTTKGTTITTAAVPPGRWTFFIKAVDATKSLSVNAASYDLSYLNPLDIVVAVQEAPGWNGVKTNVIKHWTGVLFPDSLDAASLNTWDTFDIFVPNPVPTWSYESLEIDGVTDSPARVWVDVEARLGPGALGAPDPLQELKIKTETGAYGAYGAWTIGGVSARYVTTRITGDTSLGVAVISGMLTTIDADERTEGTANFVVGAGGTPVVFAQPFKRQPRLNLTVKGATSLLPTYSGESNTGFTPHVLNTSSTDVGGTISWEAVGV